VDVSRGASAVRSASSRRQIDGGGGRRHGRDNQDGDGRRAGDCSGNGQNPRDGANILEGGDLGDAKKEETPEAAKAIENADGFAQVFPEHKFHIVDVLQKHNHIVGMTGDGVNDAPALKKADCGFAVSGATDAARAAASIVLVTPGLSVILDAIKESRKIFQRMNSYAICRIAETLRVLLFMTLAIVVFNFFPVTAIMIVMLALLNDGAILSIAYDNVIYRNQPEVWDMRTVLTVATVLGLVGPIAAFGLFVLGDRVLHIDRPQLQTMMYLLLSVAGHLTIFQTRTRGPWWTIRPARILLLAVVGTQILATAICLFGFLVKPLWWGWAAMVWAYALGWFLITDPMKLAAYRILHATEGGTRTAARAQAVADHNGDAVEQTETAADANSPAKPAQPEAKAEPKPEAKAAPRAGDGSEPEPASHPEAKIEPKSDKKPAPEIDTRAEPQPPAQTDKKATPRPAPQPVSVSNLEKVLETPLGDVLLAGLLKEPADAGRIIVNTITNAKETPPHSGASDAVPTSQPEPVAK
jgi:H+-transporting ATPase